MRLNDSVGMVVVLMSLLMAWSVIDKNYADYRGIRLYLPHECSQKEGEAMNQNEKRSIFVGFRADRSSTVNLEVMPTEGELRHLIATIMSTRSEPSLMFTAEDSSSFRDVTLILSNLTKDTPESRILLSTPHQVGPVIPIDWRRVGRLCYSLPD
jgi:biopolymer transport protein ExbD